MASSASLWTEFPLPEALEYLSVCSRTKGDISECVKECVKERQNTDIIVAILGSIYDSWHLSERSTLDARLGKLIIPSDGKTNLC